MVELLVGILILLVLIGVSSFIMYWPIKQLYKLFKPQINKVTEFSEKLNSLEKRVEMLERNEKSDGK